MYFVQFVAVLVLPKQEFHLKLTALSPSLPSGLPIAARIDYISEAVVQRLETIGKPPVRPYRFKYVQQRPVPRQNIVHEPNKQYPAVSAFM